MGARDYAAWISALAPLWLRYGLEPSFSSITGSRSVVEALVRRFTTLHGSLVGPPGSEEHDQGYDVRQHLNDKFDNDGKTAARAGNAMANEAKREPRVDRPRVALSFDKKTETLTLKVQGIGADGPFALTANVSQITSAILDGAAPTIPATSFDYGEDVTTYPDGGTPPLPNDGNTAPWGDRYLGTLGTVFDLIVKGAKQAVEQRFIALCAPDALAHHGYERMLDRIPNESAGGYRARLQNAWNAWSKAGTAPAEEDQLAFYGATHIDIFSHLITGTPSKPDKWRYDENDQNWSRFWILILLPHSWTQPLAGDAVFAGDEVVCGISMSMTTYLSLFKTVHRWRSAHGLAADLIIVISGDVARDDLVAADALTAAGEICDLPVGQFAEYGFSTYASDDIRAGYYEPFGNPL